VDALSPFLVGGPAFSGTTLLAHLLNQPGVVCLDEPDFERVSQAHRSIAFLRRLFPDVQLPSEPRRDLSYPEAFELVESCSKALQPTVFGFKTCNWRFVSFARLFFAAGLPVVLIVRDIRDTLMTPPLEWISEKSLVAAYRHVWNNRQLASAWIRYEDLVAAPVQTLEKVTNALGHRPRDRVAWDPAEVPSLMLKNERHQMLRSGAVSSSRVGIWKRSTRNWPSAVVETARDMGYEA
jgi:hypothetical protein